MNFPGFFSFSASAQNVARALLIEPVKYFKWECPKFNGEDFKGLLLKLEQYFDVEQIPKNMKVRNVMLSLEGDALQWRQFYATAKEGLLNLT